nr:MAG TPA: hypothetical protein [Caudoviricetes sp.]
MIYFLSCFFSCFLITNTILVVHLINVKYFR